MPPLSKRTYAVWGFAALLSVGAIVAAQTPAAVDYDTVMWQDSNGRAAAFRQMSPENVADIVRTQIRRWTNANRARLTAEQISFLQEMLAFISADHYRGDPLPDAIAARGKELGKRASTLFTPDEIGQAMTVGGPYIPNTN